MNVFLINDYKNQDIQDIVFYDSHDNNYYISDYIIVFLNLE
jgi:hypothetical protein